MNIREEILLNQIAQTVVPAETGEEWFSALSPERRREVLRWIANMAIQAGTRKEDSLQAIRQSGLKPTYTPCMLLAKDNLPVQLAKIVNLPVSESLKSYRLLMALFQIADSRRRATQCAEGCVHWWHRDLSNQNVLADIQTAETV